MNAVSAFQTADDPIAVLNRHAARRAGGVPTVSLLTGPSGAGGRIWRRWAAATGHFVVPADGSRFPISEWGRAIAERVDLPAAAVERLAGRAGRAAREFASAWKVSTTADRERFWATLAPTAADKLISRLADLAGRSVGVETVGAEIDSKAVPAIASLVSEPHLPAVLFACRAADDFSAAAAEATCWAERAPAVPLAVAVAAETWADYHARAPESRAKALLREGAP